MVGSVAPTANDVNQDLKAAVQGTGGAAQQVL